MQIIVNTDKNISAGDKFQTYINGVVYDSLGDLSQHLTHVGVHLSDQNNSKEGFNDKRCVIEMRIKGRNANAVSYDGNTVDEALMGAIEKARNSLEHILGKIKNKH